MGARDSHGRRRCRRLTEHIHLGDRAAIGGSNVNTPGIDRRRKIKRKDHPVPCPGKCGKAVERGSCRTA